MSWFLGHLFPASMWLLMGLFVWLQSMNKLVWTNKLRTQPKWLAFRSIAVMIISGIGTAGEIIVPLTKGSNDFNTQHITVWFGLCLCSATELFHLYKVLPEPFWCMLPPLAFSYIAVLFMLHEQPLVYWRLLHQATALFSLPIVLLLIWWSAISSRNSNKAHTKGKSRDREEKPIGCCFWRGKNLEDLCGTYTDQKIYDTIVPGFLAFFLILQSMCWYEMWWEMGWYTMEHLPADQHHPEHTLLATVIRDICVSAVIMGVVSGLARSYESYQNRGAGSSV